MADSPSSSYPFPRAEADLAADEIRFTMLTVGSEYSQDSAPSTGKSFATNGEKEILPEADGQYDGQAERPGVVLGSIDWGRRRDSRGPGDSISLADTDETADGGVSAM